MLPGHSHEGEAATRPQACASLVSAFLGPGAGEPLRPLQAPKATQLDTAVPSGPDTHATSWPRLGSGLAPEPLLSKRAEGGRGREADRPGGISSGPGAE